MRGVLSGGITTNNQRNDFSDLVQNLRGKTTFTLDGIYAMKQI